MGFADKSKSYVMVMDKEWCTIKLKVFCEKYWKTDDQEEGTKAEKIWWLDDFK